MPIAVTSAQTTALELCGHRAAHPANAPKVFRCLITAALQAPYPVCRVLQAQRTIPKVHVRRTSLSVQIIATQPVDSHEQVTARNVAATAAQHVLDEPAYHQGVNLAAQARPTSHHPTAGPNPYGSWPAAQTQNYHETFRLARTLCPSPARTVSPTLAAAQFANATQLLTPQALDSATPAQLLDVVGALVHHQPTTRTALQHILHLLPPHLPRLGPVHFVHLLKPLGRVNHTIPDTLSSSIDTLITSTLPTLTPDLLARTAWAYHYLPNPNPPILDALAATAAAHLPALTPKQLIALTHTTDNE